MLSSIIDIIGDIDISDIILPLAIALILIFLNSISMIKYNKAMCNGDIEKAEYIRKTMCALYLLFIFIAFLVFIYALA